MTDPFPSITLSSTFRGSVDIPGDKSISHRALMLSTLFPGKHRIQNLLDSADVQSTASCLRQCGVEISHNGVETSIVVPENLTQPVIHLDAGNSGTTIRLLSGLLAPQQLDIVLTGDASLQKRPMGRIIKPLQEMGANITSKNQNGFAPLWIRPSGHQLQGICYTLPVPSAQVKSSILLAGLFAEGQTEIVEPIPSRDHTERMLGFMGFNLEKDQETLALPSGQLERVRPESLTWKIPGDISSAGFLMVLGSLVPHSEIDLKNVGINPSRIGIFRVLNQMGASLTVENLREQCGEPVGDIFVQSAPLKGNITLSAEDIPSLVDEIPILVVAGAFMEGSLTIRGAEELRKKESDRIASVVNEFKKLGIPVGNYPDGLSIVGDPGRCKNLKTPQIPLEVYHDHRMAMALTVMNQIGGSEPWPIQGPEWAKVSYPNFYGDLARLQQ